MRRYALFAVGSYCGDVELGEHVGDYGWSARQLLSGRGPIFGVVPSRNELCPCGSEKKYKRCCLERHAVVARELRERDEFLSGVVAWLRDEHEETLRDASGETTLVRLLRGATGRSMSTIWALADHAPADNGPSLLARYGERPGLNQQERSIADGLAEAVLDVYRVRAVTPGVGVELEPLRGGPAVLIAGQDGLDRLEVGEILVARVVCSTSVPTVWGLGARFPAASERRWTARISVLPDDRAKAALIVMGFHPDDAAEPIADDIQPRSVAWSIDDDESVLEAVEHDDAWESLGEAIPTGWAFAYIQEQLGETIDLGGWHEDPGEIEVARLIVASREITLISGDLGVLAQIAADLAVSMRGLIAPSPDALAA